MANAPQSIPERQVKARRDRVVAIAREVGFVGRIEYRHALSRTGGAMYVQGIKAEEDLLIVYAERFERDEDPDDFSLEAIIAHERGHQLLIRHKKLGALLAGRMSRAGEEVLASLIGTTLCKVDSDRENLYGKAAFDLVEHGIPIETIIRELSALKTTLRAML